MRVEAFTNRTFFLTRGAYFAPGDAAYSPGDELELCYAAERPELVGLSPEDVAQSVYGTLNSEKPPSLAFPSLSMGEVVSCRDGEAAWSLAVELMGFSPVDPPVFASEPEQRRLLPQSRELSRSSRTGSASASTAMCGGDRDWVCLR